MKHLEGKTVYLAPTGNAAFRNNKIVEAKVEKVAKVYVTLSGSGLHCPSQKLRYKEGSPYIKYDDYAGYKVFESREALLDDREARDLADKISEKARYSNDIVGMRLDKLRAIAELLDID